MRRALHGLTLASEGPHAASLEVAAAVLEHFGATDAAGPVDVHLELVEGPRPADDRGPSPVRHLDLTIHENLDGTWLFGPQGHTLVSADGRLLRHVAYQGHPLPLHVFTCALVHLLRRWGAYVVHAASVAWEGRGVLLVGPSGAGKSTLTLALASVGAELVSDDSVMWRPQSGEVLALRRGVFLAPADLDPLPLGATWRPCPLVEAVKQELVWPRLVRRARCAPSLVVLPRIADASHTTLHPADPLDAAYALAVESRLAELARGDVAPHLRALGALAGGTPAVHALLGRDVLENPTSVAEQLQEHLGATEPLGPPPPWQPVPAASPASPTSKRPVFARVASAGGLVLHPDQLDAFALDPMGARIWELARDGRDRLTTQLATELGADRAMVDEEVRRFAEALDAQGTPLPGEVAP